MKFLLHLLGRRAHPVIILALLPHFPVRLVMSHLPGVCLLAHLARISHWLVATLPIHLLWPTRLLQLIRLAQPIIHHRPGLPPQPSWLQMPILHRTLLLLIHLTCHFVYITSITHHRMCLNCIVLPLVQRVPIDLTRVWLLPLVQCRTLMVIVIIHPRTCRPLDFVVRGSCGMGMHSPASPSDSSHSSSVTGSFARLHRHLVAPLFILIHVLPCMSALLLLLLVAWLLGCVRSPVLRTTLHVLPSILSFPPLIQPFNLSPFVVEQECISHFRGFMVFISHVFQGQVTIS